MKQIKTVLLPYEELNAFDKQVNQLLSEGWQLNKREIQKVSGQINDAFSTPFVYVLYAELERIIPQFEEVTE